MFSTRAAANQVMATARELQLGPYADTTATLAEAGFPILREDYCRGAHYFKLEGSVYDWTSLDLHINDEGLDRLYRIVAVSHLWGELAKSTAVVSENFEPQEQNVQPIIAWTWLRKFLKKGAPIPRFRNLTEFRLLF